MKPVPEDELIPSRRSLVTRLRNREDRDGWKEFFDTYWRLIYGVALKAGLSETEADVRHSGQIYPFDSLSSSAFTKLRFAASSVVRFQNFRIPCAATA